MQVTLNWPLQPCCPEWLYEIQYLAWHKNAIKAIAHQFIWHTENNQMNKAIGDILKREIEKLYIKRKQGCFTSCSQYVSLRQHLCEIVSGGERKVIHIQGQYWSSHIKYSYIKQHITSAFSRTSIFSLYSFPKFS